ncbi:protease SohB [Teredinibacter sp. KSP-S5-2]|uniref:protease SohB n=1 Tax=Teredinibacter sp. KSP-S5-2 TaxID=3034506 RepID=UPI002934D6AD|nr:protease SohB [Teredinibacter sp. KSP-S5-2]WNO11379.1 protease SohB [Teredinibacter sp. KSP-S5-2]
MEFLYEYGLFLAKAVTIVVAIGAVIALIVSAGMKGQGHDSGHIEVKSLNDKFDDIEETMKSVVLSEGQFKEEQKAKKKQEKEEKKAAKKAKDQSADEKPRVYVAEFDGDIKASAVEELREVVTAILALAKPEDEVVVKLESQGGMVHSYGLASSQLDRLVSASIPLTICVDKVAASGGYMMACVANKILAAPFAIIGSIGVVAQLPNFHRLLKKNDIDYEMLTAGEYKRTLTMFGENTDKGRQKFMEDLEDTHELFKEFITDHRPQVNIDEVATGEIWFGRRAVEKALIDEVMTSDQYLFDLKERADIYQVEFVQKKSLQEKLGISVEASIDKAFSKIWQTLNNKIFS